MAKGNRAGPFGQRLRVWRESRRLSQRDLAELSGVHFVTIARLESGAVAEPAWGVAVKLAEALGVGIEAFTEAGPLPDPPAAAEEAPPTRPMGKRK